MKFTTLLLVIASLLMCLWMPAQAEVALPNSGTYFMVNSKSGEAVQPLGPTPGNNVFMYEFNKAGAQKWTITRLVDPKTKQPTNRYNIRLAGETEGLNFAPHWMTERTAILDGSKSTFVLAPSGEGLLVKSVAKNGDAMSIYPVPASKTEVRFLPSDGSDKFLWVFQPAGE